MESQRIRDLGEGAGEAAPDSDTRLNAESPWPGLAAYDEASRDFFHGRSREAQELLRLIRLAPLTALYSKSGLGKSSLLQAGLFPLLRGQHYLPVYLRLDFSNAALDPLEQAARRLGEELAHHAADYKKREPGEPLWEYLHRDRLDIWTRDNFPLVPILVFDQFEEMFSHRAGDSERARKIRNDLAGLIENRIPTRFASEDAKSERSRLDLLALNYRVILSFREDWLPELKSWEREVPSLLRNYLRLEPMTRPCAIEAVEEAGRTVLADGVAPSIVDFVGRMNEETSGDREEIIEPVLLSLCCYQLNRRRPKDEKIDEALVNREARDILDNFYRSALDDEEVTGPPDVATFIETHLIQGDHFRGFYPKAAAISEGLLNQTQLDALTDRHRLLRVVQYADTARIELIHDRLVEVVVRARDARKTRERQAEQERQFAEAVRERDREAAEAARKFRQKLLWRAVIVFLPLLFLQFFGFLSYTQWERNRSWATLDSAVSGHRYPLSQDVANIGRPTEDSNIIYQVALWAQSVSRIHMMIFRNFNAIDLRSLYGTTVNGVFLPYGDQLQLEEGDVVVLAGIAAFFFHPLDYAPWQYFWPTPLTDNASPTGWGLLIDSKRRLVFPLPLTQREVFVAPAGDDGVEPHHDPDGAIAILRLREVSGRMEIGISTVSVDLFEHRAEDPASEAAFLAEFAAPGTTGHTRELNGNYLTIEDVADGRPLEADIKLDDYSYGQFTVPEAKQYFDVHSARGVRAHQLNELAYHQGERRFQVIPLIPQIESPPDGNSR